jgi:energy-coupling factor transport system permease protein
VEDLELMRHITIGQYLPTGSAVHRLDPRTKLLGIGLLILSIISISSVGGLLALLVVIIGLGLLARVPLGFALGGLRPALPILIIIAILQLLFGWGAPAGMVCPSLWSFWIIKITGCSILSVLAMILRLVALILLTGMLTMTSTISELTHGIEKLLRPLQKIGFPAHELAMVFTIALRFVPTLAEELEKLLKAQVARGADTRLGANPIQRIRHFLPVLIPLFLTTLRRGEMLIEAMEARGYTGGRGRTHYIQLQLSAQDGLALLLVVGLVAGLIYVPFDVLDANFLLLLSQLTGH